MSSNRHLARIIALQSLYEFEFRTHCDVEGLKTDLDEIVERNLAVYKDTMPETDFVRDLISGTMKNIEASDKMIEPAAPEWPIDQIAKMDLTILRLAIYELNFKREVPPKVVINEAVELAKSFGGENSSKFINGVLGTIYRQSEIYDPTEDHKVQRELAGQKAPAPSTQSQRKTSGKKPAPQTDEQSDEQHISEADQDDSKPDKSKSDIKQSDSESNAPAESEPEAELSVTGDPVSTSPGETSAQADAVEQYEEGQQAPVQSGRSDKDDQSV
ncbi:MAG: transcription antitermination factor NusB [bacterium]